MAKRKEIYFGFIDHFSGAVGDVVLNIVVTL